MTVTTDERPRGRRQPATSPRKYIGRMVGFIVACGIVGGVLAPGLAGAFTSNPALNSVILFVLAFGIAFSFRAVVGLAPDIAWMNALMGRGGIPNRRPHLLTPVARALDEHGGRFTLTAPVMRSLLDGIGDRLAEGREISRYLIGLLIFLGLLGTFWGLLETVRAAGGVINGLSVDGSDVSAMFTNLKQGLEAPLTGMSTAFSSSLFGLAGSLILGFLELQVGQAQNRFFNDLEDWLSTNTILTGEASVAPQAQVIPPPAPAVNQKILELGAAPPAAYIEAVVAQTAENLESMRQAMQDADDQRRTTETVLSNISEHLAMLNEYMAAQRNLLVSIQENQGGLRPMISRLAEVIESNRMGIDDDTKMHIRNLDTTARRLVDVTAQARVQVSREIRNEIKLLARTIAAVTEDPATR
jgi:hypothetical protein